MVEGLGSRVESQKNANPLALDTPLSTLDSAVAQVGFEPTASLVLSQGGLPVAYRALLFAAVAQCPEQDSNLQTLGFKPSRSSRWRIWARTLWA